ncbi:hypothetical protein AB0K00_22760 [Dactylosporangium sp. NPDC049525]|uniref:hypothetical protein n=1 Tax=Dactylosporangium sp. NPDC049525 TaxID=3154730 RepID=UPI0034434DAD
MSSDDFYFRAECENGRIVPDPSEDVIFILMENLNSSDNTFVILEPKDAEEGWYVSIARRPRGGFEVEFRDPVTREHEIEVMRDKSRSATKITLWVAGRPAVARRRAF